MSYVVFSGLTSYSFVLDNLMCGDFFYSLKEFITELVRVENVSDKEIGLSRIVRDMVCLKTFLNNTIIATQCKINWKPFKFDFFDHQRKMEEMCRRDQEKVRIFINSPYYLDPHLDIQSYRNLRKEERKLKALAFIRILPSFLKNCIYR